MIFDFFKKRKDEKAPIGWGDITLGQFQRMQKLDTKDEDYLFKFAAIAYNIDIDEFYSMPLDKVNEYMDLWEQSIKLERDIRERGISVLDEKRGMMVENRSISLEVQVSRQMLAIYQALGFKDQALSSKAGAMDDDEL